jgi:hypothetical protein
MQSRVTARLNEAASGPVYYPTAEITAALNEANRFFALLTLGLEKTVPWVVAPGTLFTHMLQVSGFADWIVPLRIASTTGAKIRPARLADLGSLDANWLASPGPPTRYVSLGADLVGLYSQPTASTTLNVTYARAPAGLAVAGDIPEIPEEYHPRLVEYAIYRLRQVEGAQELDKSLKYFDSFLDGAAHYAKYVRSRNLGSRYDKVPFEIESFDRSKLLGLRPDLYPARRSEIT